MIGLMQWHVFKPDISTWLFNFKYTTKFFSYNAHYKNALHYNRTSLLAYTEHPYKNWRRKCAIFDGEAFM